MNKDFEKICKMSQAGLKNYVKQKLQSIPIVTWMLQIGSR